jgi:L-threonylcarbamoyladenylate synthase
MILRPGGISLETLREFIPDIQYKAEHLRLEDHIAASSPGMLSKHYSPHAQLRLFVGEHERVYQAMQAMIQTLIKENRKVGILGFESDALYFRGLSIEFLDLGSDATQIGYNLFAGLRELDQRGVDVILVREFPRVGLGMAIWDRLLRAAEGHVISIR